MRNLKFTDKSASDITCLNIQHKNLHCYDIESILKLTNLEKIYIKTDEVGFVDEFIKHIHLFENLHEFSVKLQVGGLYDYEEVIKENCYDTEKVLFIKNLKKCDAVHDDETKNDCWDCYSLERLKNTNSKFCIIQNVKDNFLLNCLSCNIEVLTIIANNLVDFELTNLPIFVEKVTIIYSTEDSPSKFYEYYKSKIKLPFNCSLKIIKNYYNQYYSYYGDDDNYNKEYFNIESRHLRVSPKTSYNL